MTFGELTKSLRKKRNWTQATLAKNSRISVRTVNRIETSNEPVRLRADAVARIANALSYPVDELLRAAGIEVTSETLQHLATQPMPLGEPLAHAHRKDPVGFLQNVLAKMKSRGGPALLCVSVSSPRTIENADTTPVMRDLLEAGLHIAITSPYPNGSYVTEQSAPVPDLAGTYNIVFSRACGIAKQLQNLDREFEGQIIVMRLNGQSDDGTINPCRLAVPTLGIAESRPCIFYYPPTKTEASDIEIAAYVRYGGDRPDQWLVAYPSLGNIDEQERSAEVRANWYDYFGGIISSWEKGLPDKPWTLTREMKDHWYVYSADENKR